LQAISYATPECEDNKANKEISYHFYFVLFLWDVKDGIDEFVRRTVGKTVTAA